VHLRVDSQYICSRSVELAPLLCTITRQPCTRHPRRVGCGDRMGSSWAALFLVRRVRARVSATDAVTDTHSRAVGGQVRCYTGAAVAAN